MTALPTSRSAKINVFMADGYYDLQLNIEQLINLQEKLDLGPAAILETIANRTWRIAHIIEPIRLGLIGGGMSNQAAFDFVTQHVKPAYFLEYLPVAYAVVNAALSGAPEDPIEGETEAATPETQTPDN